MAFMTPDAIKAVRIKDSKVITIERIGKEVRIIQMSAEAQDLSAALHEQINAGARPKRDAIIFMFEHALAELDGTPLTAEDAKLIFSLLDIPSVTALTNLIVDFMNIKRRLEQQPGEPAQELTPAEKKG